MTQRDKFEAWSRAHFPGIGEDDSRGFLDWDEKRGCYKSLNTQGQWESWRDALASDPRRSVEEIRDAIAGAGLYLAEVTGTDLDYTLPAVIVSTGLCAWFINEQGTQGDSTAAFDSFVERGRKLRTKPA